MKLSKSVLLATFGLSSQFSFGQISDILSRGKRDTGVVTYNFIQEGQSCECKCSDGPGPKPPTEPELRWQLLFMIDSSACVDNYLSYVKTKIESVVAELKQFESQHTSLSIDVSFAIFSNEVKYVTRTGVINFNAYDAERYCFDIDEIIHNASLTIKENIYYLGEGVNLQRMTESAREHFDYLQEQHERSASEEELKQAAIIISQGKTEQSSMFTSFAEDYPTWFMTLTECTEREMVDSSRDCPNRRVVDQFQLDEYPERTSFYMYPINAANTHEMCDQIHEALGQMKPVEEDEEVCEDVGCDCTCTVEAISEEEGPQGINGIQGRPGEDGEPGQRGKDGQNGEPGRDGKDGPAGEKGGPGRRGDRGRDGERGPEGFEGPEGQRGPPGDVGPPGPSSQTKGTKGPQGEDGDPGQRGQPGRRGMDGSPGNPGPDGPPGKDGEKGNPGPRGQDGQSCEGTVGQDGARGPPGIPGINGRDGNDGEDGENGRHGQCGDKGATGAPGKPGCRGDEGQPGPKGKAGLPGKDGERGQPGQQGPQGPPGEDGKNGLPGDAGAPGIDGKNGETGLQGERGLPGKPGADGEAGEPGCKGDKGKKGFTGLRGKCGEAGRTGEKGSKGSPGVDGHRGPPGAPGRQMNANMDTVRRLVEKYTSEMMY